MNGKPVLSEKTCMLLAITLAIFLVPVVAPTASVSGQTVAHLTLSVTGQSLTAGFNNTVAVSVTNNYYSTAYGTGTIYDTDIAISLPTPLNLIGDNHWHFDSIPFGQTVNMTFSVYAPTSAIGSSYQATVTATYRQLGDISTTQESHAVSFTVYGWISMIIYGVQMTPPSGEPGGNATISGNVLNTGNLAAYNANVTIQSTALAAGSSSSAFIGEIDPNIPRPFSLLIVFKPNLGNGNYSLMVKVSAIDTSRPGVPIISQKGVVVQIRKPTQQPATQRQAPGLISIIFQILRDLYNAFIGSLTGILSPLAWPIVSNPSPTASRSAVSILCHL